MSLQLVRFNKKHQRQFMQEEIKKELVFEYGHSRGYLISGFAGSFFGVFLTSLFSYESFIPGGFMNNSSNSPNWFVSLFFAYLVLLNIEDVFLLGSKIVNYNAKIREIFLTYKQLHLPNSYGAKSLTAIDWKLIKTIKIRKYSSGLRSLYLFKHLRKLVIETDDELYELHQSELCDVLDFKPLCLTIAARVNCEFEYS